MSRPPQYAQRKDGNQQDIIDALEEIGCDVWVAHQPVDLIVGFRGRSYLLEVKRPKEKVRTPAQLKFHRDWRGHKAIVRTAQEAIDAVMERSDITPITAANYRLGA